MISLAVDAVIYLFDLNEVYDSAVIQRLSEVATIRTVDLYTSMAAIATRSAEGARRSRDIRGEEVARAAGEMAARVSALAAELQARDESQAVLVADSAVAAAQLVETADLDQSTRAGETAAQVATEVRTAAATAVRERATRAAALATTTASAAREIVRTTEQQNVALELEASATAAALRGIVLETCYQAALDAAAAEAGETFRSRYSR